MNLLSPEKETSDFIQSDEEQYIPADQTSENKFDQSELNNSALHFTNGLPILATESSRDQSFKKGTIDDQKHPKV